MNEAFAAQALAVVRELGLPEDRTNPNGSGVSLGHPIGATGAILAVNCPGRRITLHEGNIGEAADCRRVLHKVIEQHGRLDILVNNAGITIDRAVAKMTDEDWNRLIAVNLSSAFFMAQAAVVLQGHGTAGRQRPVRPVQRRPHRGHREPAQREGLV